MMTIYRGTTFYKYPVMPEWHTIPNSYVLTLWNAECGPYHQEKLVWKTHYTTKVIPTYHAYIFLSQEFPFIHSLKPSHIKETESMLRTFEQSVVSFQLISEPVYTT